MKPSRPKGDCIALTRIELLAVVATVSLLSLTLVPAIARTHIKPQTTQCLNNLRQLMVAWMSYANESNGRLVPNHGIFPANQDYNVSPKWVAGDMRGTSVGIPYTGIDATNTALLLDPKFSQLGPYVRDPLLFKCPMDQSTWVGMPRVRSYSMSQAVGSLENGQLISSGNIAGHWLSYGNSQQPGGTPWRVYLKDSDIAGSLGPADLWVLLEEHLNSINDAAFAVQMPLNQQQPFLIDFPTKHHSNGCGFGFADGHVELHRWTLPGVIPPEVFAAETAPGIGSQLTAVPNDPDILWLAHHTSALAPGAPNGIYQP